MNKNIICIFFLFFGLNFLAQESQLDEKYTVPSNTIFNTDGKVNRTNDVNRLNFLKFSPSVLLRQRAVLYYERNLIGGLCFIGGLGKAFGKDIFETTYLELFRSYSDIRDYINSGEILENSSFTGSSPYLNIGVKLYIDDSKLFNTGFIQTGYCFEKTSYSLTNSFMSNNNFNSTGAVDFTTHHVFVGFGVAFTTGDRIKILNEIFFNVGSKWVFFDELAIRPNSSSIGGSTISRTGAQRITTIVPAINITYVLGIGF